jgi:hypothetical protein
MQDGHVVAYALR